MAYRRRIGRCRAHGDPMCVGRRGVESVVMSVSARDSGGVAHFGGLFVLTACLGLPFCLEHPTLQSRVR